LLALHSPASGRHHGNEPRKRARAEHPCDRGARRFWVPGWCGSPPFSLRGSGDELKDQSQRLLERADELLTASRTRIGAQRARYERNHALLMRHHRRLTATRGPGSDAARRMSAQVAQLRRALESRATIDQAKGIVMADRRCDADEAFRVLVNVSQDANTKLRDVADLLVSNAQRKGDQRKTGST
jgi:hypothetical protein